ncbi:putative mfs monosaccharide transporter [Phaeomoniella chlamydospora]|uniref:Putative mfs monosaccharide transporter n=1 Tax=Phaeomoniella chlamydospora TaxID=158046 RepID=A0A0G2E8A1_PHACM|nr:putative mfs monosaccharide transporter [Phaeomoniella chlamydospora]
MVWVPFHLSDLLKKKEEIVLFSSVAIALYGYDQGMMSLINTNFHYLKTMGIGPEDPLVGIIVSVYYLGCTLGAVLASWFSDAKGRKPGIFACLATASLGNLLMFIAGLGFKKGGLELMLIGRIVMGLGVGGIDAVVPIYSAELASDHSRGKALAKEFQANIFGLNMAFIINVCLTHALGKWNQWAWRLPIIIMQVYPFLMFAVAYRLPETPRWYVLRGRPDAAKRSLDDVFGPERGSEILDQIISAHEEEEKKGQIGYIDMLNPSHAQFHPTCVVVMGQINQALTGYGAVSVYGPQIFELLGFGVAKAEFITLGNYIFYFIMMTLAWILIDRLGRRRLMIYGAGILSISFGLLAVLGGLAYNQPKLHIDTLGPAIPGVIILYFATITFGIAWLVPPWLIPTEIYPSTARAQGSAISVIIWGLANFAVTLLTPIGFNNLNYMLFLVFAVTNGFAAWWTDWYCPESGGRSFEENQEFFEEARKKKGSWRVMKVKGGRWLDMPDRKDGGGAGENGHHGDAQVDGYGDENGETRPLLAQDQR